MDSVEAESTPTTVELVELANTGFGTEKIMFSSKNGNHDMLYQVLLETYPKLKSQNGAFELLKPESGGIKRPLILLPPQREGYPISYLKKIFGPNSTIYIRPVQSDLPHD